MTSIVAGLGCGLVATILMTAVMMAMGDGGPPPTADLVAKLRGGASEEHAMPGMVLHVLYGVGAGAAFAVGAPLLGVDLGSLGIAIGAGAVYGVALAIGGMVFWMRLVLGMDPDRRTMSTFGTVHVVYGVALGAFVGSGVLA